MDNKTLRFSRIPSLTYPLLNFPTELSIFINSTPIPNSSTFFTIGYR